MLQLLCLTKKDKTPTKRGHDKTGAIWLLYLYCMKAPQRYIDNEYYDRYNDAENDENMAVLSTSSK